MVNTKSIFLVFTIVEIQVAVRTLLDSELIM